MGKNSLYLIGALALLLAGALFYSILWETNFKSTSYDSSKILSEQPSKLVDLQMDTENIKFPNEFEPVVLSGDTTICTATYIRLRDTYSNFGLTPTNFSGDGVFQNNELITTEAFPGYISITYPTGYAYLDGLYPLVIDQDKELFGIHFINQQTQKMWGAVNIIKLGKYSEEENGSFEKNLYNQNYYDARHLQWYQEALARFSANNSTSCLVRTTSDQCEYLYLLMQESDTVNNYTLDCYTRVGDEVFLIDASLDAIDTSSLEGEEEWNNMVVWIINHIKKL